MERMEAERAIVKHLKAISKIVKDYGSTSGYLGISIFTEDGHFSANNEYYSVDKERPISVSKVNGHLWHWGVDGEPDVQG